MNCICVAMNLIGGKTSRLNPFRLPRNYGLQDEFIARWASGCVATISWKRQRQAETHQSQFVGSFSLISLLYSVHISDSESSKFLAKRSASKSGEASICLLNLALKSFKDLRSDEK